MHGDGDAWRRRRYFVADFFWMIYFCVGEEFIVVAGIVVDEIDSSHEIVVVFINL